MLQSTGMRCVDRALPRPFAAGMNFQNQETKGQCFHAQEDPADCFRAADSDGKSVRSPPL